MEIFYDVLTFSLQALVIVLAIAVVLMLIAGTVIKVQGHSKTDLDIEMLDSKYDQVEAHIQDCTLSKKELKDLHKKRKAEDKADQKNPVHKPRLFVLDFVGDVRASAVEELREEISGILLAYRHGDEVLVKIESPGGMVHGYGLAASQLLRLKSAKIPVVASVDKVAASGGYLMACVADKILAAPFAVIGSIGVVAQVPNFHRLLKKHDVEYREYTAGEFKRTVSLFGEITSKGEEKFKEQLEETHVLFKSFVGRYRQQLDMPKVATGEHWYGENALEKGLIDEVLTSDDYVLRALKTHKVLKLKIEKKQKLKEKLSSFLSGAVEKSVFRVLDRLVERHPFA